MAARGIPVVAVPPGMWKGMKKGERVVVEGTQKVRGGIIVKLEKADKAKS